MSSWRLSKYDPSLRDPHGRYLGNDWTSSSQIGQRVDGAVLTLNDYLHTEAAYVAVALSFHQDCRAPIVYARDVEPQGAHASSVFADEPVKAPVEGSKVAPSILPDVLRACLREQMWCRLEAVEPQCQIHFGYDFYVYLVGAEPSERTLGHVSTGGLFLEAWDSPYRVR